MGILYDTYKQDKEKWKQKMEDEYQDILQGVAPDKRLPEVSVAPEQRARIYAQWMLGTTKKSATKPVEKPASVAPKEAPRIPDRLIAESLRKAAERRRAEESARLGIKGPPLREGESAEFARKHPTLRTILYYATAPLRAVLEQPFVRRTGEVGAEVFTGVRTPRAPTGSRVADVAAELLGTAMGFATGGPRTAVQSVGGQLWTGAERLAEHALTRIAPKVAASELAKRAITGAAATVPYDIAFTANEEHPDLKTLAINALAGGLLNVLPEGIAALAARRRQAALPPPRAEVKPPEVTPEAPPAPPKAPETPVELPKPKEPVTAFKAGDRVEWTDAQGNTLAGEVVRSRGFLVEVRTPDGATLRVNRAKVRKAETVTPPPEQPPVPPERPPLVPGKTAVAKTERGTAVETEFAVVNADDLITSHDTLLRPDERYPKELQPRERTRQASELQVSEIASKLEPEFLGESPKASEGAPIVGPDLIVESGNARTIALKRLYESGHENAEKYRRWLLENAKRFGLDPAEVQRVEKPVLVRVRRSDVDRLQFVREANEQAVAAMSASEQALADAGDLTGDLLDLLRITDAGEILTPANMEFVRAFMREIVGPAERDRYLTAEGSISQEGVNRIKNAIFARAYGDPTSIAKLAESTDNNIRNITNAMLTAAPRLAKIKDKIARGELFDLDITGDVAAAANKLSALREQGMPVQRYLQQVQAFDEELSPLARDLLDIFNRYGRSGKKLTSILQAYADIVEAAGNPKQVGLFDKVKPPTRAEALEAALRKAGVTGKEAEAAQAALFGNEAVRGLLAAAVPEGKPGEGPGVKGLPRAMKTGAAGEPVKRIDIVRYLEEKLLVPIRTGRLTLGSKYLGQYDVQQEVVRTRKAEDLESIAHEVGHHLTKKLGLNYNAYPELERLGARLYPNANSSTQREEGLAEFFRYYLVNPTLAQAAPTFYRDFEASVGRAPELEQVMREAQRLYRDWFAQDAVDHVKGVIVSETVKEKPWLNLVEKFHADWKDALYPLYKFVKTVYGKEPEFFSQDAYKLARLAMGTTRKAWAMLERAAFLPDGTVVGPSLREILKPVRHRIDDFTAYITARRAVELHGRGIETGIDPAKAFEAVRQLDSPEFRKALDDLQAYQDALLVHLVDSGVLSAKQAALFKQLNQDYVPFYRFFGGEETVQRYLGKRFADLPQGVKRIKGSTRSIIDPLESIVKNTIYFIDLAERNRVARAVADAADQAEGLGWLIEKLPMPLQPTKFELGRIKKDLIAAGIPEDVLDQANLQQIATVFYPVRYARPAEKKENILTVWRDGKPTFYKCHPDLYRALEMLDEPAAHWFVRLLSFPARTLRLGAVLHPEFIARNPARDQLTAFLQSRYGFVPVVDLVGGMYHVFRRTDVYKQWEASGGAMATLTSLDRDYLQGALSRLLGKQTAAERAANIALSPVRFLQFLSESLEEASRVAEFAKGLKKELAKGVPEREARLRAAFASREVTLDFSRAGHKGRQANQFIAFFNAALEGPSALKRTFQRDPVGATIRAAALITLPSILLYARNHSKPEYEAVYQELPRWRKDLYWCIPTDDGKIYYIPKPFEAGVLFGSFFERMLEYARENDPKGFKDWVESAVSVFSPGFIPTALIPIIEIWSNRSFFTRQPIVPMREQKLEPEEQYGPYTSETAKAIGRMFNVSPRYVEQAVRGYFGGLGMHGLNLLDLLSGEALEKQHLFEVTPFERAFVGAPWRSAESIEEFYKELDRLETKYNTAKEKLERGEKPARKELSDMERLRRLRAADKYLQRGRQLIRKIQAGETLSPEEKREKVDRINLQMVNIARLALGRNG